MAPYGGLQVVDGSAVTQALTTTAGALVAWAGTGGANSVSSNSRDGDVGVIPDKANSRILLKPGIYRVSFDASLLGDGTAQVIAKCRKNGTVVSHLTGRCTVGTAARGNPAFTGYLEVLPTDSPDTVADWTYTGTYGPGLAPKTNVPIDMVLLTTTSTVTVTVECAHFNAERVG